MEISFTELKNKEIVNVFDGRKLGRIIDILFDNLSGTVKGIVVPGERKIFRKNEDIFVPLEKLKKIGDDVILVNLPLSMGQAALMQNARYSYFEHGYKEKSLENRIISNNHGERKSFVRYKRIDGRKYK